MALSIQSKYYCVWYAKAYMQGSRTWSVPPLLFITIDSRSINALLKRKAEYEKE